MAENKKSFILYADQIHLFESLSDDEAGKVIKHLFRYINDLNPELPDRTTQLIFEPIKQQLKRDLETWKKSISGKSEGGKKSAEMRKKLKEMQDELDKFKILQDTSTNSTVNVNDNVNVNVNDDYYIVNGKIEKGNVVDWYLKTQPIIFEAELMKLNLSGQRERIISAFRNRFINGSSFNDYKHITNSFRKHIEEIEKIINKPSPKLVR